MPEIFLELILYPSEAYGRASFISLPLSSHVHKRLERFIYQDDIQEQNIPIVYLENKEFDSWHNLQIANRTYNIPLNSAQNLEVRRGYDITTSLSYSSEYKDIIATNETYVDEFGKTRPLFFRHVLPDNVAQAELVILERGNRTIVDSGFRIDLDKQSLFTNYRNFYDADKGNYKLFFVVSTDSDGNTFHDLLNPASTAKLADWPDIDLETGTLTEDYPVYSREKNTSGYTFYFNQSGPWYIRPLEKSLIQPVRPTGREPEDAWFLKFTNGDITALTNDSVHRYYLPEFDRQPFAPFKPIVYSPYERLMFVNEHVVAATRQNLKIDPENGFHISIFIYNVDGILIRALSTDGSLEGERFSDTDIFFETDKILSWDNLGGFIALGIEQHRSWDFRATYYYEADDLEYTTVNLNPLIDPNVFNNLYIFYMIPDADLLDTAIHHLVVDKSGIIVSTSQSAGLTYPNLQLLNSDGSFNTNTVIGLKYVSDIETDTFTTRYAVGFSNTSAYSVLAEVSILDTGLVEDQFTVDSRRRGAVPTDEHFEDAIGANPKILQSYIGYSEDGQETPQNAVMILKAPTTLLEDRGGVLTQTEAERLLRLHAPSAGYSVIDWEYPNSVIDGESDLAGTVSLAWSWEGSFEYRLYRASNPTGEWSLIYTTASPPEAIILYTDIGLESEITLYYSVRIFDGTNEFPMGNTVAVRTL